MTVLLKPTLKVIQSHLEASGYFKSTGIGEPRQPPDSPHACVVVARGSNPTTTLNGSIERRVVIIRLYTDWLAEPIEDIEFWIDEVRAKVEEDLFGDFTLGGTVRNIEPTESGWETGSITIGSTIYRTLDYTLSMTIDDSSTYAP